MKKQKSKTIVDNVKDTVNDLRKQYASNDRLANLEKLTREMMAKGLLKRQDFGLPPIDTIGKTAFRSPKFQTMQQTSQK